MLKWEKQGIAFVEKHLLLLAVLAFSMLALLMRRQNIWFYVNDYAYAFDMHEGNLQSPFYYIFVLLYGYIFYSPLHGWKWVAGIADFAVAGLAVAIAYCWGCRDQWKFFFLFLAMLYAPIVYVSGCVCGSPDSLAMALLMAAWFCMLRVQEHGIRGRMALCGAALAAAAGAALVPQYLLLVWVWLWIWQEGQLRTRVFGITVVTCLSASFNLLSAEFLQGDWQWGFQCYGRWLTTQARTGQGYLSALQWVQGMLWLWSYPMTIILFAAGMKKKLPWWVVAVVELILTVYCGGIWEFR